VAALTIDLGRYERGLREQGFSRVAGVDEAGRGALAARVAAYPCRMADPGIADSKVLTADERARLRAIKGGRVRTVVVAWRPG
jgi:ribonuclease HII